MTLSPPSLSHPVEAGRCRPQALLRSRETLMRPETLAAIQPSRVSASRTLIARASRGRWRIACERFDIDDRGRGEARYGIEADGWRFSFPVFSFSA